MEVSASPKRVLSGRLTVTVGDTLSCVHLGLLRRLSSVPSGSLPPSSLHYFLLAFCHGELRPTEVLHLSVRAAFIQGWGLSLPSVATGRGGVSDCIITPATGTARGHARSRARAGFPREPPVSSSAVIFRGGCGGTDFLCVPTEGPAGGPARQVCLPPDEHRPRGDHPCGQEGFLVTTRLEAQ